jgi:hypothetical protein
MPKYLVADAEMDFPVPNGNALVAKLRRMYDGRTPVTTKALATFYGVSDNAILAVLRRCELVGMVRKEQKGWIPLQT